MASSFRRIMYLFRQRQIEADLAEEMDFHRSLHRPWTPACSATRRSRAKTRAGCGSRPGWRACGRTSATPRDRSRGSRPLPLSAIAIVALGTGATTGVFGLLDGLVVRSLPVEQPHRLVWFRSPSFSYPIFTEVQARLPVFDGFFGWNMDRAYVDWTGAARRPRAGGHSRGHRRLLLHAEGAAGGRTDVRTRPTRPSRCSATAAWRRHFGGDPSAIGRSDPRREAALHRSSASRRQGSSASRRASSRSSSSRSPARHAASGIRVPDVLVAAPDGTAEGRRDARAGQRRAAGGMAGHRGIDDECRDAA